MLLFLNQIAITTIRTEQAPPVPTPALILPARLNPIIDTAQLTFSDCLVATSPILEDLGLDQVAGMNPPGRPLAGPALTPHLILEVEIAITSLAPGVIQIERAQEVITCVPSGGDCGVSRQSMRLLDRGCLYVQDY